jgi:ubiquinone/menaquinone biosynthesis C-methylase UbiE
MTDIQSTAAEAFLNERAIHEEWESEFLNRELDRFYDAAFAKIALALGARPGDRLLDAGCGYCYHAVRFVRRGLRVTGVDFSDKALESAREVLRVRGLQDRVDLRQADLRTLPFPDGSFTLISCWGVLMHIPEAERVLTELVRVLAPGGRIALMENNLHSLQVRLWDPLVRTVKRAVGRPIHPQSHTVRGAEEWRPEGLMVRRTDFGWLIRCFEGQGLRLVARFAAQFTEAYTNVPGRMLKSMLYRINEAYLRSGGPASLALGNVAVFEKRLGGLAARSGDNGD